MTPALLVVRSGLVMLGMAAALALVALGCLAFGLVALAVCALWRVFNLPARVLGRPV